MALLQFDTKYYYAVGTEETRRKFWFRTPPKSGPDVPYTFGLIGINIFFSGVDASSLSEYTAHQFCLWSVTNTNEKLPTMYR
jgi:hypothetical protein